MGYPKIFVAGCWDERTKIHEIIKQFEEIADVTHDWTVHESEALFNNKSYLKCQSLLDVDGLERADYLVVIMDVNNYSYMGTWTEIGMAIMSGVPVLMYNPINVCENNIYMLHPLIKRFDSLNNIAEYLKND